MLNYLWHKLIPGGTAVRRHETRRRTLCLELLEDRCLLSTVIAEFPVKASSAPSGITTGPDGNIWFTEHQASQIGVLNPATHVITEFPIPTANAGPTGITAGPDGNLWFTESAGNSIGVINPTTHAFTEFTLPTANSQPTAITTGPDGNLWFTETASNQIGAIDPGTHTISEFPVPTSNSSPAGITAGPDGNLWFTENNSSKIGTINPVTHLVADYSTPSPNSQPVGITAGPDGNLWFTENKTNRIVKVFPNTHGMIEMPIPARKSGPFGITAGADGNLWFVENNANQIGSINPTTGVVTETALSTAKVSPTWIATGPGGVLFFTEPGADQIGEVVASPVITATPASQTVTAGQTVTLTATATGLPVPAVIWQVSTDAGLTFTPLANAGVYSGVTTDTLTINGATTAMTGYRYQAVFSNGISPSATTVAATLTVNSVLSIMPALPQGTPGVAYNQTISVVGGSTAFTLFSVNSFTAGATGLLFANITTNPVNGTITIAGTPTAAGTASFIVAVANTAGNTLTQTMVITISPPLSIATPALPSTTAGMLYSQTINVIGGAMPYTTFAVTNFDAGTTGLTPGAITTLGAAGTFNIHGMPIAGGTVAFTVNVTDSAGITLTKDYTITVNPPLVITPSLPQGTVNTNYHQTVTVSGGAGPYTTFTVTAFSAGTTGLTLANVTIQPANGTIVLDGTPTVAGTLTFTANIADSIGAILSKTFTIKINPALSITPSLPQGTAGASYHQIITVAGGSTPYTTFSITGFSAGGTGMSLTSLVSNAVTGTITINVTPTASGTTVFTVNVIDAAGSSLSKVFNIAINPAPTLGNLTATQWTAGTPSFPGKMTLSGGSGPYLLAGVTGLPTGLTATLIGNTLGFVGTPTTPATFANGSITIHDAVGASVTKTFSITINPAPAINNLSATQWTVARAGFNGSMTVAGGTGGLSIVSSAGVPTGLTIVLNGNTISFTGTPTAANTFAGSVTLRDAIGATVATTFTITINATPTLGNLNTTLWTVGKSGFTGVMTIGAGTGPFTITNAIGLPTGMTAVVNGNTIRLVGTPSAAQTFSAGSITLHDAAGASVTRTFSITINPPVSITTLTLPGSKLGMMYSAPVHAHGGTGALTFSVTAGSLPPGMRISSNGIITGVSRGFGSFTFTITATDAVGATFNQKYALSLSIR